MKVFIRKYSQHIIAILLIAILSALFVPNNFKNKAPKQSDIVQYRGAASEIIQYRKNGENILWTNSLFAGMPSYVISLPNQSTIIKHLKIPNYPRVWSQLFLYIFCSFIMLLAFKVRPWLALIGAIGIGLATENLTILAVGHNTKARAIGYLPLVIAGMQYIFNNRYLLGLTLLATGFGLELQANHIQITYYGGFMVVLFVLFHAYPYFKEKRIKAFFTACGIALAGAVIGLGANSLNILLLNEYAKESIRGESELSITKNNKANADKQDGLTQDYVFSYSNGWSDIGATIIPNYSGGDSDKLGLYYGQIGSTSGPKYIGATLFILMILGLVVIKGPQKWWLVSVMILTLILSMGGNHFTGINQFMYNYFPLYNKFRAPSMMMVLVQISAGLLAFLGLEKIISQPSFVKNNWKKISYTAIGGIGVILLLSFSGTLLNDFNSTPKEDENGQIVYDSDTEYAKNIIQRQGGEVTQINIDRFKDQLSEMRLDEVKKDGKRSLFFAICIILMLWLIYKEKIKVNYGLIILGLLITADLWTVGKRYLNDKDFKRERTLEQPFTPYAADLEIQKDKTYYRVLDLTQSTLNSNRCANFHKSIGGYSAAKIRRFQDLWDWHLMDDLRAGRINDNGIFNMLNMKYYIYPNQQSSQPVYGINPNANGNAWIVNDIKVVENADSAIVNLPKIDTKTQAIVEKEYADFIVSNSAIDNAASIKLTSYHPEKLEYSYSAETENNVAFSEVFYDKGWNAYIDNQPVDHFRLNYILRGLKVPAGKHSIRFEYDPKTFQTGSILAMTFGSLIYLLIGLSIFLWVRKVLASQD
jgi:hypothetical protein